MAFFVLFYRKGNRKNNRNVSSTQIIITSVSMPVHVFILSDHMSAMMNNRHSATSLGAELQSTRTLSCQIACWGLE